MFMSYLTFDRIYMFLIKNLGSGVMKQRKIYLSLVVTILLTLVLPLSSFAKDLNKEDLDYVSFGDSLAAGMTPYGEHDESYADFLTQRFEKSQYNVEHDRYGVSGFTSSQLLEQIQKPEVIASIIDADIITIDIGANDTLPHLENPAGIPVALQNVAINLSIILGTIDRINPDVEVYVMGYYNAFPYLPKAQQDRLMPMLNTLNSIIKNAATMNGDYFVPTEKVIAKRYQSFLPNPFDIHLSLEGYQAVAKEFWKVIDSNR